MNDFLNNDAYDWESGESSGVLDLILTCGAAVVSQDIKSTLARFDNYSLLTNESISLATRKQILRNAVLDIEGVSDVDLTGFNPQLSDSPDCRTGYSYGTICPVIDCDNSQTCTINI